MTFSPKARQSQSPASARLERPAYEHERSELPGMIRAGVMTFLLSGDLRLATRATRLLIADSGGSPEPADPQMRTRAGHRVWHRRR